VILAIPLAGLLKIDTAAVARRHFLKLLIIETLDEVVSARAASRDILSRRALWAVMPPSRLRIINCVQGMLEQIELLDADEHQTVASVFRDDYRFG
jgi:hypothetical protein